MNFMQQPIILGTAGAFEEHTTQKHPLGTLAYTRDGRVFRYAKAGGSALVTGNLLQSPVPLANHLALTPAAAAIGAQSFTATLGATAASENEYAEGWVQIDTTPGNGYGYPVSGHASVLSAGVITINLPSDAPIQVALTTSSRVGLHHNPYRGVIQCPTTITAKVVGVAVQPIAAASFGWIQVIGPVPLLINGTPAITAPVINSATTAGAVDVWTAAAQPTANLVGHMMQVGVSGKNNMVFINIG
jgi:hypothetical protein